MLTAGRYRDNLERRERIGMFLRGEIFALQILFHAQGLYEDLRAQV
jgi:hypothetical protein